MGAQAEAAGSGQPKVRSWTEVSSEQKRLQKMMEASAPAAGKVPHLAQCLHATAPCMSWTVAVAHWTLPMARYAIIRGYRVYRKMPHNAIRALTGAALLLFGGTFPTVISAWEAALATGWDQTRTSLIDFAEETERIIQVLEEDDKVDADRNGVADVDEMSGKQLVGHKLHVFFDNADAQKLNRAMEGIAQSATAVCAVLRVEYARTIALSLSISKMLHKPVTFILSPSLHWLSTLKDGQPHYQQWVPIVIDYTCKSIGLAVAWKVQRCLSAFHSACRGGLMLSQALLSMLAPRLGWHFDEDVSSIDDYIGWVLAAGGFYYQLRMGFALPFPLNVVLIPARVAESWIQWQITYGGSQQTAAA